MIKTLLLLLASTCTLLAQTTTNLPFTWNPTITQPDGAAFGYKFYEKFPVGGRLLLGTSMGTNRLFTVSNYVIGTSRQFAVTATNLWGESPESTPYVAPALEPAPVNLRPVSWFLVAPVPGVVELSQDLTNWTERIRVRSVSTNTADLELVQSPRYPVVYGRVKPSAARSALPRPLALPPKLER